MAPDLGRVVVLHSGGIDSTTTLFWARKMFSEVISLGVFYGQKNYVEVSLARKLCEEFGIRRLEVDLAPLKVLLTTSSLVGEKEPEVSEYPERGVISTYVPFRNTLFGVIAGMVGENLDLTNIAFGVHASDVPNYPDTRPEWSAALEAVLTAGSKFVYRGRRFRVYTPLAELRKVEIVQLAKELGVPFELTCSCYTPKYTEGVAEPCMRCPACNLRKKAFEEAGIQDRPFKIQVPQKEIVSPTNIPVF